MLRINGEKIILCKYPECKYSSVSFNRIIPGKRHSISQGFEYKYDISSHARMYTNLQSFRRHLKSHRSLFYDSCFWCYEGENHNLQAEVD